MLKDIYEVAKSANIDASYVDNYGKYKAKIDAASLLKNNHAKQGKLVLVTAITPTKVGEGKTTMSIALHDGLRKIGVNSLLCLREPSLGPVFGLKGGATGGGLASVCPSEDINLHFTGDMHALTSSINLISAIIDNHIYQGNELHINPEKIYWKRALDMNDRALRDVKISLNEKDGVSRIDHFQITVASELMAIFCLCKDEADFYNRINNILVASTYDDKPVYLKDLRISNAIMKLMREALKPNLVQTLENNPVLIHGGPFANIAHGCNSIIALKLALQLSDITITEAGFGADLGAEKFFDIACPTGNFNPNLAVCVATIKALKLHGGVLYEELSKENVLAMLKGAENLRIHLENLKKYNVEVMVAINHFANDSEEEVNELTKWCSINGYLVSFVDSFAKGSDGAIDFANKVKDILSRTDNVYTSLYDCNLSIKEKIEIIAKEIYRATNIEFSDIALEKIKKIESLGYSSFPICMAKTPLSLTDSPKLVGCVKEHTIHIKDVSLSSGAKFIVALTGKVMTMPGLPKVPTAVKMEDE